MLCDVKHFAMRKGEMKLEKCNHVEPKKDDLTELQSLPFFVNVNIFNYKIYNFV